MSAEEQDKALAAAEEAAEAVPALLQFARKGEAMTGWAFDIEVAAHLAQALKNTLEIELPRLDRPDDVPATRQAAEQLLGVLATFLEAWT